MGEKSKQPIRFLGLKPISLSTMIICSAPFYGLEQVKIVTAFAKRLKRERMTPQKKWEREKFSFIPPFLVSRSRLTSISLTSYPYFFSRLDVVQSHGLLGLQFCSTFIFPRVFLYHPASFPFFCNLNLFEKAFSSKKIFTSA